MFEFDQLDYDQEGTIAEDSKRPEMEEKELADKDAASVPAATLTTATNGRKPLKTILRKRTVSGKKGGSMRRGLKSATQLFRLPLAELATGDVMKNRKALDFYVNAMCIW